MRVAIIGLGLIGGSLGLALKESGVEVVGYARRPETASSALSRGVVDRCGSDMLSATKGADIIVIATPVLAVKDVFVEIAKHLPKGAIVTDVASTKSDVMKWAAECLPARACFIGGHPMAGKETSGITAADSGLFRGCTYCLIPGGNVKAESRRKMEDVVKHIGARPFYIDADEHDALVASVSHLPHLLSVALVATTVNDPRWTAMSGLASSGYRDTTRLASGDPRMIRDILLTNKEPIIEALDKCTGSLNDLRRLIRDGDKEKLEEYLIKAKEAREDWLRQR
jgi:prephenate dehydrogenase